MVALSKRDAVDDETAALARLDVEELLAERRRYAARPLVETSVRDGRGLDELRAALDAPQRARGAARRGAGAAARSTAPSACTGSARSSPARSGRARSAPATAWRWSPAATRPGCAPSRCTTPPLERAAAGQRVAASLVGLRQPGGRGQVAGDAGRVPAAYRLDVRRCAPWRDGPAARRGACGSCTAPPTSRAAVVLLDGPSCRPARGPRAAAPARAAAWRPRGDRLVAAADLPAGDRRRRRRARPGPGAPRRPRGGAGAARAARGRRPARPGPGWPCQAARWPRSAGSLAPARPARPRRGGRARSRCPRGGDGAAAGRRARLLARCASRYAALRAAIAARLRGAGRGEPLDPAPAARGRRARRPRPRRPGRAARRRRRARARGRRWCARPGRWPTPGRCTPRRQPRLLAGLEEGGSTPPDLPDAGGAIGPRTARVRGALRGPGARGRASSASAATWPTPPSASPPPARPS